MLRIIVRTDDAWLATNVGGSVLSKFQTFDIDAPEIEAALKSADRAGSCVHVQVVGVEVLPHPEGNPK